MYITNYEYLVRNKRLSASPEPLCKIVTVKIEFKITVP